MPESLDPGMPGAYWAATLDPHVLVLACFFIVLSIVLGPFSLFCLLVQLGFIVLSCFFIGVATVLSYFALFLLLFWLVFSLFCL